MSISRIPGVSQLEGETFFSNTGMLKMLSDTVTIERNKTAIRNLLSEVINTGRLELCDRYLAADRVDHQDYGLPAGAADGHEGFKRVLGVFRDAFPDLKLTIDFIVADRIRCRSIALELFDGFLQMRDSLP
jgi:SnoaL-like polyketide cyclase